MAFKKGDKVVIVKTLGQDSGYYSHGGHVNEIPLKSKGTVIDINRYETKNEITIKLGNGKIWYVDPGEIQLTRRATAISQLGKFPECYTFKVASQTPAFLLNDRMYILDGTQPAESAGVFQSARNGKTEKRGLAESSTLASLEELTYQHNLKDFNSYERKYLEGIIKQKEEQTLEENKRYKLVDFIVNEVFPYFKGNGSENPRLEKLLDVKEITKRKEASIPKEKKQGSSKINSFVSELIKEIEKEKFAGNEKKQRKATRLDRLLGYEPGTEVNVSDLPKDYTPRSLLGRVLEGKNAAVIDGVVYNLLEIDSFKNGYSLTFDGKTYALVAPRPVSDVANRYRFELSKQVRINALKTKLANDKKIQKLESKDAHLRGLVRKKEYKEGDFGFIRNDKGWEDEEGNHHEGLSYLVTFKVPGHVLKLPDNEVDEFYEGTLDVEPIKKSREIYFYFKPTKAVARVFVEGGNQISYDGPYTAEPYNHPFSQDSEFESEGICLGDYPFDKLEKMERGKAIARLLLDTRNIFLSGYMETTQAVTRLSDEEFLENRIYPGEIKRRNLKVTNVKLVKRRSRKK